MLVCSSITPTAKANCAAAPPARGAVEAAYDCWLAVARTAQCAGIRFCCCSDEGSEELRASSGPRCSLTLLPLSMLTAVSLSHRPALHRIVLLSGFVVLCSILVPGFCLFCQPQQCIIVVVTMAFIMVTLACMPGWYAAFSLRATSCCTCAGV